MENETAPSIVVEEKNFQSCSTSSSTSDGTPCILVLGMAGSGKTSFVQRLTSVMHAQKKFPYVINLDPATASVPYPANVDIRDTIKYKAVMSEYGLGPNGAIMTCLNLLCTRFHQVMDLLKKRENSTPYFLIDTPGQIEAFTWSASGTIITDTLASTYPTMIAYVVDSARAKNPTTFMSNMLYACSILYRTKLPFFIVFNKADIVKPDFATKWMGDFESFQEALDENQSTYMNDLTRSLSLVLDSFYENLNSVAVSSRTGEGFEKVLEVIEKCKEEYKSTYKPMYDELMKQRNESAGSGEVEKMKKLDVNDDSMQDKNTSH
uniref:GPN-loop GTPase n=1 Tax=Ditylenchus dipsaci TaxID=166011 RepID=A0A915EB92_9BILA